MRILGVDPGLGITGYGLIETDEVKLKLLEAGVIRTSSKDKLETRLEKIYRGLYGLIEEIKPDVLVIEKLYSHYKHPATAILMGHCRGVICLLSKQCAVELIGYSATRVKKAISGMGHAGKYQVQKMVQDIFNLKVLPSPPDISDALALAVAHAYISQKRGLAAI